MPLFYCCMFLLLFFLSGCTIKPTTYSKIDAQFLAATDINKNTKGNPSPVQVFIYQISNLDNFSAENPLMLMSSIPIKESHDYRRIGEIILQPGQQKTVAIPLETGRNTLAFVAAFRDHSSQQWSVIHTIDNPQRFFWEIFFRDRLAQPVILLQASTLSLSKQGK